MLPRFLFTIDHCQYYTTARGARVRVTSKAEQRRNRRKANKALRRKYRKANIT